jgi:hypothetical protein
VSDPSDLTPLIGFMLVQPGMVERVLAEHIPNLAGDCTGCGGKLPVKWQCVHHFCATRAQELSGRLDSR